MWSGAFGPTRSRIRSRPKRHLLCSLRSLVASLNTFTRAAPALAGRHVRVAHQRLFFSLPGSSSSSRQRTHGERVLVRYPPSDIYEVVADVESYPEFVPACVGATVLHSRDLGGGRSEMDGEYMLPFPPTSRPLRSVYTLTTPQLRCKLDSKSLASAMCPALSWRETRW